MILFDYLAQFKVYFNRVSMYLGIVNFSLILANFKLNYGLNVPVLLIVPLGFIAILLVGWLDYKFIMKYEITHANKNNDVKEQLNKIQKQLEDLNWRLKND